LSSANAEGRLRRSRLFLLVRARAARSSRIVDGRAGCRPNCRARPNGELLDEMPAGTSRAAPTWGTRISYGQPVDTEVGAGTNFKGRRETGCRDRSPGRRRVSDGDPPHRWRTRRFHGGGRRLNQRSPRGKVSGWFRSLKCSLLRGTLIARGRTPLLRYAKRARGNSLPRCGHRDWRRVPARTSAHTASCATIRKPNR
jgi:hypothetical protein